MDVLHWNKYVCLCIESIKLDIDLLRAPNTMLHQSVIMIKRTVEYIEFIIHLFEIYKRAYTRRNVSKIIEKWFETSASVQEFI